MKSNLRNEIKSYIVRSGCTMQEVVDQLSEDYGWKRQRFQPVQQAPAGVSAVCGGSTACRCPR